MVQRAEQQEADSDAPQREDLEEARGVDAKTTWGDEIPCATEPEGHKSTCGGPAELADEDLQWAETTARTGLQWLADRCDGALDRDGQGFSSYDSEPALRLLEKSAWSSWNLLLALVLTVKYRRQLASTGMDIERVRLLIKRMEIEDDASRRPAGGSRVGGWAHVETDSADEAVLVFSTSYDYDLKEEIKKLPTACWHPLSKRWTCALTAETAARAEELAAEYGFKVEKHDGWHSLPATRQVWVENQRLLVEGVNAWGVVRSLDGSAGDPVRDEALFSSILRISDTRIGIPIYSWVIRRALKWLKRLPDDDQLVWAKASMERVLREHLPAAVAREAQAFRRVSAKAPNKVNKAISARLPAKLATALMPHQWIAAAQIAANDQTLLADEQGLGKTLEILAGLEAAGSYPAVVLCPKVALLNWRDEARRWLPDRKVTVIGSGVGKTDRGAAPSEAEIILVNYESFAAQMREPAVANIRPMALVADEAHYLKSHDSQRTVAVKKFLGTKNITRVITATGTPLVNRPAELLTLLTLHPDILEALGGFWYFAARYCRASLVSRGWNRSWDFSGAGHLDELGKHLRATGQFIRRTKADVLPMLKPKLIETKLVAITNRAEYKRARNDFQSWIAETKKFSRRTDEPAGRDADEASVLHEIFEWCGLARACSMDRWHQSEALRRVSALRQLTGQGKIASAVSWVEENLRDENLVVFAYHLSVQRAIADALEQRGVVVRAITGEQTPGARMRAIHDFQSGAAKVVVCSLTASRTAITLHAAARALVVELDWSSAGLEQAEDRIHRIGQEKQVVVTYLVARETLDDRMIELVSAKRQHAQSLTGDTRSLGQKVNSAAHRRPGPGRPRLEPEERGRRRKISKANWQAKNKTHHANYVRRRYWETRRVEATDLIKRAGDRRAMLGDNASPDELLALEHEQAKAERLLQTAMSRLASMSDE